MAADKLTKKQRKTQEFRGKDGKKAGKTARELQNGDVQAPKEAAAPGESSAVTDLKEEKGEPLISLPAIVKGKKKAESVEHAENDKGRKAPASKPAVEKNEKQSKRKREDAKPSASKKRFDEEGNVVQVSDSQSPALRKPNGKAAAAAASSSNDADAANAARRYILFVGNMSFKSTVDEIIKHFSSHCGEQPSVRLLTTKTDPTKVTKLSKSKQKSVAKGKAHDPGASQSKGCAFVEFKNHAALQKALQFHHTQFQGRTINVELTAGGGGKGASRAERIKEKNKELEVERRKLHEKYVKTGAIADAKKAKAAASGAGEKDGASVKASTAVQEKLPGWGPNATKGRSATKVPRWAASGANAVRLAG